MRKKRTFTVTGYHLMKHIVPLAKLSTTASYYESKFIARFIFSHYMLCNFPWHRLVSHIILVVSKTILGHCIHRNVSVLWQTLANSGI